jgi:phage tail-like protein
MPTSLPGNAYNFRLDMDGRVIAVFTQVTPPAVRVNTIEYREGGGAPASLVLPGRVEYTPVVLRWGLGLSDELFDWLASVMAGRYIYRDLGLMTFDNTNNQGGPTMRYNMIQCLPSAWYMSELNAAANDFAIESLELRYQELQRERLADQPQSAD